METFLIKAAQLILALAILIIIHEFGHFLFARIFGVKVEKFYIFFNPVRSLFKWRPKRHVGALSKIRYSSPEAQAEGEAEKQFEEASHAYSDAAEKVQKLEKKSDKGEMTPELAEAREEMAKAKAEYDRLADEKLQRDRSDYAREKMESRAKRFWGHTEYGIGWIPLGGYCKISGMIDESMDTEQMKKEPEPWEFRTKPAWQRLLIMIAGVLFNFLLAIIIYAGIVYATGEKYVPLDKATMGMHFSGEALKAGFRNGDIILEIDGEKVSDPGSDRVKMLQAKEIVVLRDGKRAVVTPPEDFIFRLDKEAKSDTARYAMMTYQMPTQVNQLVAGGNAEKAGLQKGDIILGIDSVKGPLPLEDFFAELPTKAGQQVNLLISRKECGDSIITLPVAVDDNGKIGIGLEIDPSKFFEAKEKHYNLLTAIPRGIQMGTDQLVNYASSMKMVATKEGAKSIGGFGSIGSIFPEKWNWIAFWNIAAFLSVALAFMNFLPIPALDGGHILFLLVEMITGKAPSQKFLERAQMAGMIFLILLLLYANGMDIVRLFQ